MSIRATALAAVAVLFCTSSASALTISSSVDAAALSTAVLADDSGITIVESSESYTGEATQGGTFSDFSLSNSSTTVGIGNGVVLTTGDASGIIVSDNTDTSFDGSLGTPGDADLTALNGGTATNDANFLEFSFTVAASITSVQLDLVFGSDEFPDQTVTDIFGFFVDGVNYAEFSDGSLINFTAGSPAESFFNNNDVGNPDPFTDAGGNEFQYDGFTSRLLITGLLDTDLTTHTVKIAIADTSDTSFDSGVFVANLRAGQEVDGGISVSAVPLPMPAFLLLGGLGMLGVLRRKAA